jgi:prevent-host-death family protein
MAEVTVRELRNDGGRVLDRVAAGEALVVTRDGSPVAELRPLPAPTLDAASLLARWRQLPPVDPERLQADIDSLVDPTL